MKQITVNNIITTTIVHLLTSYWQLFNDAPVELWRFQREECTQVVLQVTPVIAYSSAQEMVQRAKEMEVGWYLIR